jgi:hypothetical protein
MVEFSVLLLATKENPNTAYYEFPYSALDIFGSKARIPVRGTVDGYPFRSSLAPMGGYHLMVINKEMRNAIHKKAGDTVHIILERDTEPRFVTIPQDFQEALDANLIAKTKFETYSYSHKNELVTWINDCKKAETRLRRIEKAIETLL